MSELTPDQIRHLIYEANILPPKAESTHWRDRLGSTLTSQQRTRRVEAKNELIALGGVAAPYLIAGLEDNHANKRILLAMGEPAIESLQTFIADNPKAGITPLVQAILREIQNGNSRMQNDTE